MKRTLLALGLACLCVVGFSVRTDDTVQIPFDLAAAAGWLNNTDGREHPLKGTFTVNKFGFNGDVDASEESIWDADDLPTLGDGPARCFANIGDTAAVMRVSSDSAADAGLGISIEVLDANWVKSVVLMDLGVAAATTGTVYAPIGSVVLLRVNRALPTGDAFTGNIYIHTDVADTGTDGVPDFPATQTIAVVTAGENQTLQACYSVPVGFSAMMKQYCIGNLSQAAGAQDVTFRLRKSVEHAASRTTELKTLADEHAECDAHDPPIMFAEKTDIELTAIAGGPSQGTSGTFDLILIPNDS